MRRKKQSDTEHHVRWLLLDIRDDDAKMLDDVAQTDERSRTYIARKAIQQYLHQRKAEASHVTG